MNRIASILASGTTLLFALILATGNAAARDDKEVADAQKELEKVYELIKDGHASGKIDQKKLENMSKQIKAKFEDLNLVMSIYKPSKRGGLGFNPAKKVPGDGIEKRINDLATMKEELSKADLSKEKDLLIRAALYNLAIHEVSKAYTPTKAIRGKGAKDWKQHNDEMKGGSEDLIKAAKAGDPKALKKAAGRINNACNDCHTDFRS